MEKSPLDDKTVTIKFRKYVKICNFLGTRTYSAVDKTNDRTLFYSVLLNSTNFPPHLRCLWRVVSFCVSGWEISPWEIREPGGGGVVGRVQTVASLCSTLDPTSSRLLSLLSVTSGRHHLLLAQHLHSYGTAQLCHAKRRKEG